MWCLSGGGWHNKMPFSLPHCKASPELLCNLHKESCSFHEKQNLTYFSGWMFIATTKSFPCLLKQFYVYIRLDTFHFFLNFPSLLPFYSIWQWTRTLILRLLRVQYFQLLLINASFCIFHSFKFILQTAKFLFSFDYLEYILWHKQFLIFMMWKILKIAVSPKWTLCFQELLEDVGIKEGLIAIATLAK